MAPRVSVLLPCFNGESFVAQAVDSILQQTFGDFQLVIVNDGSTDGSLEILEKIAATDSRVKILSQSNGGIVAALNLGLSVCEGMYVARMDADDVSLPDRLALQVAYLDEHPNCVLVGGNAVDTLDITPTTKRMTGGRHRQTDLTIFPPKIAVAMHPLIMVRRDILMRAGGYRADFPHAEDYDLYIRLSAFGTIDNPPVDLLYYRRHADATSIRHVEIQEQSAAMAEIDAMLQHKIQPPPDWLAQRYIQLRIWRRYIMLDRAKANRLLPANILHLLDPTPKALSRQYLGLRVRILAALARWCMPKR